MDPLTHTLAALMISRAGPRRPAPRTTLTLLVAANLSDLDYLYALGGAAAFYEHHRGWTHSLLGALALAAATSLAVQWWARKKAPARVAAFQSLLAAACLGAASHLLLDWATPSGIRPFWPFRGTQSRLDWFSTDVWLLLLLLAGLALPALLGLIAEEIGARRDDRSRRRAARVTLIACLLLAGARAHLHGEALAHLESRLHQGRTPLRSAAVPTPLNPFRWEGIVETSGTYELAQVRLAGAERPLGDFTTVYKPSPAPALDVALATSTAQHYLARARFPQVELLPGPGQGWVVRIRDLGVSRRWVGARQFLVRIDLDRQLKVERETLFYGREEEETGR